MFEFFMIMVCETLDDIKMHLSATEYGSYLQNEPSPLHTTIIMEKCTLKFVDEYKHMLCKAPEPLSTFLEYITDVQELLEKCHPLGMFDRYCNPLIEISKLYRLVLVDTPLAPHFSECITSKVHASNNFPDYLCISTHVRLLVVDLDDMNIEIMRNTLYRAYIEDFYKFS
ncbi:hypothetical protein Goklo_024191, partial [Gossypium klotzschianum]|nr:hypothetical protein [Gossypium klotzschianum]